MQDPAGLEVSPKKAEYICFIYENEATTRTSELATHFCVSPSTATKTVHELAAEGLVEHVPYHGVRVTHDGERFARFHTRRHRILALVLSRFGLSAEEACHEARRFEAYVPKGVIDRMCASLGHPIMSVCGRIEHDSTSCCPDGEQDGQ